MVWHPTQASLLIVVEPAVARAPTGARAGRRWSANQAAYSSTVSTISRKRMRPCWWPQYSEQAPMYVPVLVGRKWMVFRRPGIMSSLPPICGTQKLWMTSTEMSWAVTLRSTGTWISLAVTNLPLG